MTGPAFDRVRAALETRGSQIRTEPWGMLAQCPAHDDGRPSLSVRVLPGRVRLHCFAGCEDTTILDALGLTIGSLFDDPRGVEYRYADGRVVHRSPDKRFRQSGNTSMAATVLYRLDAVADAVAAGEPIYLVEGEQDAETAALMGLCGTTAPGGAGNFGKVDVAPLRDAFVVAVPDRDAAGEKWLAAVREKLVGVAAHLSVRAVAVGKDLTDHYAAGHSVDELTEWQPAGSRRPGGHEPGPLPADVPVPGTGTPVPITDLIGRDGLLTATATRRVLEQGPIANGPGGLHAYLDGVWQPSGPAVVRHRVYELLGERARKAHADTIVDVLQNRPAKLTDEFVTVGFLNLPNGLLDWRSGVLQPHTADLFVMPRIPVEWDPEATCPAVTKFLGEVFGGPDCVDFALEVVGYCLLNDQPLHKAILLFGRGRNGKGTFLRLLQALIGSANVCSVSPQKLDDDRFASAELHGHLANLVGDVDPTIFRATETFKMVTGGDTIGAQRKYGQPFRFTCRATIVAAFNALPRTSDGTTGFFSRWLVVPMPGYFPAGVADPTLDEKLRSPEELRGLLVLAVGALARLMARGRFDPPAAVLAATDGFRETADPIRSFLGDTAPVLSGQDNAEFRPRAEVYRDYDRWAELNGYQPYAAAAFYERFEAAGAPHEPVVVIPRKRDGTRGYLIYSRKTGPVTGSDVPVTETTGHLGRNLGGSEQPQCARVIKGEEGALAALPVLAAEQPNQTEMHDPTPNDASPLYSGTCGSCGWPYDSQGHVADCDTGE